jgi:parallel beta-helix repeat protein
MLKHIYCRALVVLLMGTALATPANADTITVCWDGSGDYLTIQEGIDAAQDGDAVVVCDGTYTGVGNRNLDFGGKSITVRSQSGNPAACIIDCGHGGRGFYFHSGEAETSVLDGFTITHGNANPGGAIRCDVASSPTIINCMITNNVASEDGGAIVCWNGSDPMITNCTIADNTAGWGAGLQLWQSDATISDCTISGNTADNEGGGVHCWESSPTIANCTITGNTAHNWDGAGIFCGEYSLATITECIITENAATHEVSFGGGVYCLWDSDATITDCTITDNFSACLGGGVAVHQSGLTIANCTITGNTAVDRGGGVCDLDGWATIANCTITGNTANRGGGVCSSQQDSRPTIIACTIAGNSAIQQGGGMYCSGDSHPTVVNCAITSNTANDSGGGVGSSHSTPTITNCTIAGNSASDGRGLACDSAGYPSTVVVGNSILWDDGDEVWSNDDSTIVITYSDIQSGCPGQGNIDADPLFVDPANEDYHFLAGSPCINGGSNYAPDLPDEDIEGNPRIQHCRLDMGAYESPYAGTFEDCNANGEDDDCDVYAGTSEDYDQNHVPDECEDCNANGVPDGCDIDCATGDCASHPLGCGGSDDYDLNGVPDECEDCNENGVPDACDLDCATGNCAAHPLGCGGSEDCQPNAVLDECDIADGTSDDYDLNGVPDECEDCNENGVPDACDLDCDTGNCANHPLGCGGSEDFDLNGLPDECDPDCNANGVPDACDLDCDTGNCTSHPLGCGGSADCNGNGVPDECDIADGTSEDCQPNGVPDECDIADGTSADCQHNGVPDECDIADGTSEDANGNGVPDECEEACQAHELAKLLASDGAAGDAFGGCALCGDVAVIKASGDDDNGSNAGSAYVFRFDGSTWMQETKLLPSDGAPDDHFGSSVGISGDAIVIGAHYDDDNGSGSGSAYVFRYDGATWMEEAKLLPSDGAAGDDFGFTVAISGDTALIGAPGDDDNGQHSGSAYVFRHDGSSWIEEAKLLASDGWSGDEFGYFISISGDTALIGAWLDDDNAPNSGSAYVFRCDGSSWIEEAKLLASDGAMNDGFGVAGALSGNVAIIGAPCDDDSGTDSGSAYVFERDIHGMWAQAAKLTPIDGAQGDLFGYVNGVALFNERALVGTPGDNDNGTGSGSVYVFERNISGVWTQAAKLTAADGAAGDAFGLGVALFGHTAVVGAYGNDDNGSGSGSAYAFHGLSDCQPNGVLDICDINNGTSDDANGNGIPDECEGPECPGDLDGDLDIDLADLAQLLAHYGMTEGATYEDGDLDADGDVDLSDLAALLAVYGTTCE